MLSKSWDEQVQRENDFTTCANSEDSDQPVHLQSIFIYNVLHFIMLIGNF